MYESSDTRALADKTTSPRCACYRRLDHPQVLRRSPCHPRSDFRLIAGALRQALTPAAGDSGPLRGLLIDLTRSKQALLAENALLRQQLIVAARRVKKPRFRRSERLLLVALSAMFVHCARQPPSMNPIAVFTNNATAESPIASMAAPNPGAMRCGFLIFAITFENRHDGDRLWLDLVEAKSDENKSAKHADDDRVLIAFLQDADAPQSAKAIRKLLRNSDRGDAAIQRAANRGDAEFVSWTGPDINGKPHKLEGWRLKVP